MYDSADDRLTTVKAQVDQYLNDTMDARLLSERDRDYYDHKQWTPEEVKKLAKRNQAPIVVNRVKPKVEGLIGLYMMRNSDPKAYPRTKKHEKSAEAITDALRYVGDRNDMPSIKMEVANEFFVEGTGGAIIQVKQKKNGETEIEVAHIPWDRLYYDPHSRAKDFEDARYLGQVLWMDEEEVAEKFPDADLDELYAGQMHTDETFEDRPRWHDTTRKRVRVAMHFYLEKGTWMMCVFTHCGFLVEPQESPFLDDEGLPSCPIVLVSGHIDRDNNRYGEVRGFISQQDEINHRRSKALHLLSQRQTAARQGAIKDVPKMKRELAKPDGHVEYQGEKGDFEVLGTGDMAQGQFELYQDAKAELDAVSVNAQLSGDRQQGDLSGIAIQRLQSAGTMELNRQFELLRAWERRVYRHIWARVKQFWTEEKWIRVTDDQDSLRWVGLNSELTAQQFLEDTINDESKTLTERRHASAAYQFLMKAANPDPQTATPEDMQNAPQAQQMLEKIVGVSNPVPELDVDIILDQSFDTINVQKEQFEMLAKFAGTGDIDITELIELSQLRGKDELIEKIQKRRQEQAQAGSQVPPQDMAKLQIEQQKHQDTMQMELLKHKDTMELKREELAVKSKEKPFSISVSKNGEVVDNEEESAAKSQEMQLMGAMANGVIGAINQLAMSAQQDREQITNMGASLLAAVNNQTAATQQLTAVVAAPKRIVRKNGKAEGVEIATQ